MVFFVLNVYEVSVGPGVPVTRQEQASLTALALKPNRAPLVSGFGNLTAAGTGGLGGAGAGAAAAAASRFRFGSAAPVYVGTTLVMVNDAMGI